ncbi:MAG: hypothetical protein J6V40_01080 [Clostridia bacterium]|nr:hypothetical protein [Clostridia bacterium]MBO7693778.1 hypothetical protein [Methanobrevibacter sp.]
MNDIMTMITTVGFPIVACIGLAWFCKFMIDQQQKNIDKMFEMYDKSNAENREAIKACTDAINRLSDKLDDIK